MTLNAIDQFKFPDNHFFLKNALLQYKQKGDLDGIKDIEKQFKKYSHISKKGGRPLKALSKLKYFAWFLYPQNAPFKLETVFEGLVLIFLLDEMADNNRYSFSYRKKFLREFAKFIKDISLEIKINAKDIRQKEMQEVWLSYFKKIYYRQGSKKNKWIKASYSFVWAMLNELENKKYGSLKTYLGNATLSSGALFFWQSIITEANCEKQNNAEYDKLTKQIAMILRLTNDFAQAIEDKNKITALNFCRNKNELKNIIEKELKKFQKMIKKSPLNKKIRVAMWRSAIFLYCFYQKDNF